MEEKKNNFPLEIKDVDHEVAKKIMELFSGDNTGYVRVGPSGYFFPVKYKEEASRIYNMALRPDDVFVASYPRSGTTWTQELVWMVANNLDFEKAYAVPLTERFPFLEYSVLFHPLILEKFVAENKHSEYKLELLEKVTQRATDKLAVAPSPRFVKTHLPLSLLPPDLLDTAKVVYVARDPRDVVVSFYHLNQIMRTQGYLSDFKTFWDLFVNDLVLWTPYFTHLKESWAKRHHPNMLFLFYEELSKDLPDAVRRVCKFLKKDLSEEQIAQLCDHLSIDNFKNNKSVNFNIMKEIGNLVSNGQGFIRKGKSGGWRDYFDDEMTEQAERWIADNLGDTDMRFPRFEKQ